MICKERLGHCIRWAVEEKLWNPILLNKDGRKIFHLFFADDLTLFLEASKEQIGVVKSCLKLFCDLYRQKKTQF